MELCHKYHGAECEKSDISPSGNKSTLIRFVDVHHRCIVTKANVQISDCRYVALSYVWGGPQEFKLETSNADRLAGQGSLCNGTLPQTIEDAIFLTQSLELQYLWIDALCIIQDDDADKEVQIASMSQIYGFSFITLVAASAASVHGGIPGLRKGSRSAEQKEVVVVPATNVDDNCKALVGLSLMTTLQPVSSITDHYLDQTVWNSRGWTMQERALSRRVLVFTHEQMYWVCREATFCEESYFENDLLRFNRFHDNALEQTLQHSFRNFYEPENEELRVWKVYQRLVAGYTRRTFSFQGDAFAAFLAILQGLSSLSGEEFIWGLPRSHFEQSLLWNSFTKQQRREELSTLPMTSKKVRVPFPSWSWIGWIGETFIRIGDELFDSDSGEVPEIICFEHKHAPFRLEQVRQTRAAYEFMVDRSRSGWKMTDNQPVTIADLTAEHPQLYLTEMHQTPEMQVIFFWTSSAFFTVSPSENDSDSHSEISDSRGNVVGSARNMTMNDDTRGHGSPQLREFIVIASRRNRFTEPTLLVLQIEWRNSFAYRVNYAEIAEDAWLRKSHSWKLIPLR
ncbi:HET-domain-containing protein [Acephala macrosclerotiorum]|nr:HET-domain-containing protein [Acephala macrosclerotiorum]